MDAIKCYYIPPEILRIIVNHLNLKDFLSFRSVCQLFYKVASRQVYHENFLQETHDRYFTHLKWHKLPNGLSHGRAVSSHDKMYIVKNFYEGKLCGPIQVYTNDHRLLSSKLYENGKLNGSFIEYFEPIDDNNKNEGCAQNGKLSGSFEHDIIESYSYYGAVNVQSKKYHLKYIIKDGKLLSYEVYMYSSNGKKQKLCDYSGALPFETNEAALYIYNSINYILLGPGYFDQVLNFRMFLRTHDYMYCGHINLWSATTGKLLFEQYLYDYNGITGWRKAYHENGILRSNMRFFQGNPIHWVTSYNNSGQLIQKSFYNKNGQKNGWDLEFRPPHLIEACNYENGNLLEARRFHNDPNNRLSRVTKHENNRAIGNEYHYNNKGFLIMKHNYIQYYNDFKHLFSVKDGMSLKYNGNANLKITAEIPYVKGHITGLLITYYNTGRIHKIITYDNDTPCGHYKVFNKQHQLIEEGYNRQTALGNCCQWRRRWDFYGKIISEEEYDNRGTLIKENIYTYITFV